MYIAETPAIRYNKFMVIMGFFSWWYGDGWKQCVQRIRGGLASLYDYFSFDLLLKTLFAPFRQIDAGQVRGSMQDKMKAFGSRLFSRVFGAFLRTFIMIIGVFAIMIALVIAAMRLLLWPILPLLPIVFLIFAISGWVPWTI